MRKKVLVLLLALFVGGIGIHTPALAASLTLFTPYTGVSVTPGETVNYSVELINNSSSIQTTTFDTSNLPKDWNYTITSDGREIEQLSVKGNDSQEINFEVQVPLKVEKGKYQFKLIAQANSGESTSLPFLINITEQGTFKTELEAEQPNMEGHAGSTFSYQVTLKNRTADEQHYALSSAAPKGWDVQFKADGNNITSATLEPNSTKDIDIEIKPPEKVKADTYKIPIKAATNATSASTELEAVITGNYEIKLSTPSGKLNTDITAGREKTIELQITNSGTAPLRQIELDGEMPPNWDITFEQKTIQKIEPGQSEKVKATIKADKDAIAGDYVAVLKATAPEASSEATFRISVETSVLWGFVGVLIILAVLAGMYYLFKKYGRR
ncbi:hypothetical protein DCC39_18425 [Pueribacillus theae]|uniref:Alpha-galactosidase NEW3 domain-containing protein n=2 Tax=Pueribacillus theae TaxID=2171751 RepID=A0A2U1JJE1_9BACI|nr:hypothetical protein DCC39_18425 [Pueribacillus theae]